MNEGKISAFQASADWRSARPARPAQHVQRCGHCAYVPKIRTYVRTTCVRTCARGWRVGMMSFRHPPPPHLLAPISLCVRTHTHARHARAGVQVYVRACARTCVRRYVRTNVRTYVRYAAGGNEELPSSFASTSLFASFAVRTCVRAYLRRYACTACARRRPSVRTYVGAYVRTYVRKLRALVPPRMFARAHAHTHVRMLPFGVGGGWE